MCRVALTLLLGVLSVLSVVADGETSTPVQASIVAMDKSDIARSLSECKKLIFGVKSFMNEEFKKFAVRIMPKVMALTPPQFQPQVIALFEWIAGSHLDKNAARLAQMATILPQIPIDNRVSKDIKITFLKDLHMALQNFKLKHTMENIKGESGTVTGDNGLAEWYDVFQSDDQTKFEYIDDTHVKASIVLGFNVNVTYEYHLRTVLRNRDGYTLTTLADQFATIRVLMKNIPDSRDCYIEQLTVEYPNVLGEVVAEVHAKPTLGSVPGYNGGGITATFYPQCHTDIESGIKKKLPDFAASKITQFMLERLGDKVCTPKESDEFDFD